MGGNDYGVHLMLRVAGMRDSEALGDPRSVDRFLTALVDRIGMSVLAGPLVGTEGGGPDRAGVSGVVILYESHAAVHTYPARGEAFVDVFSCRPFATAQVVAVLTEHFGPLDIKEQEIRRRGRHWGADAERELAASARSR
jgi:S-adenosylmethionine decarboxylase